MALPSVFNPNVTAKTLARLEKLQPDTQPLWGKMDAAQMLAHLNVGYGLSYGDIPSNNSGFMKFFLKLFIKKTVVGEKPYKKNSGTAPAFKIADARNFQEEKTKLINYVRKTEAHGVKYFEGKESPSFGPMTAEEWSNQFYKHLDHHFQQFGI